MAHYVEIWRRPGHISFGRVIDDPPFREASWHDGMDAIGDGTLEMPASYDRFDDILFIDRAMFSGSLTTLVRVRSDVDDSVVGEWIVSGLDPTAAKNDPFIDVYGRGIKSILTYARTEPFDWDGSDEFISTFPDWIWGGDNILGNPSFEDQTAEPRIYWLLIDATAGTFTLSDGTDTTSAIPFSVSDGVLEAEIEADIAAIDDINVSPIEGAATGYQLLITAGGGTFVIEGPSDDTGALSAGIGAAALETAIEGLAGITDVDVTAINIDGTDGFQIDLITPTTESLSIDTTNLTDGSATMTVSRASDGFVLEFVTPPTGMNLSVDDSGLTGTADLQLVEEGALLPSSWTRSQQVSTGTPREFGVYDAFEPSMDQAHSGDWSLFINPGTVNARIDAFAGTQQLVNVEPGGLYQASVWVFPTDTGQQYRLVVRGLDEDLIARADITPPPNVWTQVTISDITIPDGDDRVIFRFASTNLSGNPAGFYVDDAALNEGQAAATAGKIIGDLYDDATSGHVADGRLVWEDAANPGTPYITLDFTDTVDSNGDPWDREDLSVKVWQRMDYLHVMQILAEDFGYEWRIVPDDIEAGTWLWQIYNPEGMDDAPDVALLGGSSDVSRQLRRFIPSTHQLVEGEARVSARAGIPQLESALGRIEASRLGRNLPDMNAAQEAVSEDVTDALVSSTPWSYEVVNAQDEPGTAYRIGDTITVHDPPEADGPARLWDWVLTMGPERETTEVQLLEEPA